MTTTEHQYSTTGYRIIPEFDAYMMNAGLEVWSVARHVPCKGGKTRLMAAKLIKQDDGRVTLSQDSRRQRFHVYRDLYPLTFPDLVQAELRAKRQRPQVVCRKGHPLVEFQHETMRDWMTPKPHVSHWGTGNRICLYCSSPPRAFATDNLYSRAYGVGRIANYTDLPAEPKPREYSPLTAEELEWLHIKAQVD